ncbi:Z354B protein, partial [Grallaria varia]|nr:Z354B protein [Grallaria varia]
SLSHSSNLVVHEQLHTGEKPCTCLECRKSFRQRSHLICHQEMHTRNEPYKCLEYGK